jgi:methanogenic corrinoid protein MtbC1
MSGLTVAGRLALAHKLRGVRERVAEAVTDEFFARHPDWLTRYGEPGRKHGIADACFHMDFLAGAVEGDSATAFAEYARWTVRMLGGRGIEPRFVAENLEQIGRVLIPHLGEDERTFVIGLVSQACTAAGEVSISTSGLAGDEAFALTRGLFLQAILQGNRVAACNIATEAVRAGHPVADVYAGVLQESLYEVGRLWEGNRITVATEHMATAVVQFVLAHLYSLIPPSLQKRGNAVITGVEGELHQVGANMVADMMEANGWSVRFLGVNVPHAGVLRAVEEHRAEIVGISTTMLFNLPKVRRLVADVREKCSARPLRILIGGGAFRSLPLPAEEVGADDYGADLASVLALTGGSHGRIPESN